MDNHRNTILAIVLSVIVLVGWQYFVGMPQLDKQREAQKQQQQQQQQVPPQQPGSTTPQPGQPPAAVPVPGAAPQPAGRPGGLSRDEALKQLPRTPVTTPRVTGSVALKGGRIDDLALLNYRVSVDPNSQNIILLSPSGAPEPFYVEFGWVGAAGANTNLPGPDSLWTADRSGPLTPEQPVTLTYDNGAGLKFRRALAIDRDFMFTVTDEVENTGSQPVTLYNYGLVSRHGTPKIEGYYISHEGLIGVLEGKLHEIKYGDVEGKPAQTFKAKGGWLGITDKYWSAVLVPDPAQSITARFSAGAVGTLKTYQSDFTADPTTLAPGGKLAVQHRLFAGAKEVALIDRYEKELNIPRFDLLIDWGWFYFITKPMFQVLDYIYRLVGNFGIAILIVTVLIKVVFFPLANKSYASMAKMKSVQPKMEEIRKRFPEDKVKQQQAMMELYKQEKINPLTGCLPIVVQIPVFFALYKVLFVTIEMRHAPFYGWIKDLSAPDPTNLFNLFGMLPFDPTVIPVIGPFLHIGIWPLIMGVTMFAQMKLNPPPPDPTQKMIFDWMPVVFTFMLASFSAGLVIYWAWNNTLSVLQQSVIMKKHGAKIELIDNVAALFKRNKPPAATPPS
ncbi:MAG TPA: membrane protein insertase YidC [Xanthobacteraceae bacterium]|nr:membrane protein insertase YidC [Xanthobacteraceae bacterium]